jgi:hypothetical protein
MKMSVINDKGRIRCVENGAGREPPGKLRATVAPTKPGEG